MQYLNLLVLQRCRNFIFRKLQNFWADSDYVGKIDKKESKLLSMSNSIHRSLYKGASALMNTVGIDLQLFLPQMS